MIDVAALHRLDDERIHARVPVAVHAAVHPHQRRVAPRAPLLDRREQVRRNLQAVGAALVRDLPELHHARRCAPRRCCRCAASGRAAARSCPAAGPRAIAHVELRARAESIGTTWRGDRRWARAESCAADDGAWRTTSVAATVATVANLVKVMRWVPRERRVGLKRRSRVWPTVSTRCLAPGDTHREPATLRPSVAYHLFRCPTRSASRRSCSSSSPAGETSHRRRQRDPFSSTRPRRWPSRCASRSIPSPGAAGRATSSRPRRAWSSCVASRRCRPIPT